MANDIPTGAPTQSQTPKSNVVELRLNGRLLTLPADEDPVHQFMLRQSRPLANAHSTFRKWLGEEYDMDVLNAVLAAAASNRLSDPLWLMVIGGSGNGKTETIVSLESAGAHIISTISSEGALLSATHGSDANKEKTATGGILQKIGRRGVMVIKDFTSILSMPDRASKPQILAALREVHDGRWVRNVGSDGGQTIEWKGHLTIIAACTTAWDTAYTTIAAMGDRFAIIRNDSRDLKGRLSAGRQSMQNVGHERQMRAELKAAAKKVLDSIKPDQQFDISDEDADRILQATNIATMARSTVDFDYRGKVQYSHDPEAPTRLAKELIQLMRGAMAVGLDREDALELALRCARDSMPPTRFACLLHVAEVAGDCKTNQVAEAIQVPWSAVDRALQALHSVGLLRCAVSEELRGGKEVNVWRYSLAPEVNIDAIRPGTRP